MFFGLSNREKGKNTLFTSTEFSEQLENVIKSAKF